MKLPITVRLRTASTPLFGLLILAGLLVTVATSGQSTAGDKESVALPTVKKTQPPVTKQQEAMALEFAAEHHPELSGLLKNLRRRGRVEYRSAIRDLAQTAERLERLRERLPERYELSLRAWKLDSRIQLLAARLSMSGDPAIEEPLRELLAERVDVRRQQLDEEIARLQLRLERVSKTRENLAGNVDPQVDRDLQRLKRLAARKAAEQTAERSEAAARRKAAKDGSQRTGTKQQK